MAERRLNSVSEGSPDRTEVRFRRKGRVIPALTDRSAAERSAEERWYRGYDIRPFSGAGVFLLRKGARNVWDKIVDNIKEVIYKPNVIIGLILVVLALLIVIFSSKIARKCFRAESEEENSKISLRIKTAALIVAFVGAILVVVL